MLPSGLTTHDWSSLCGLLGNNPPRIEVHVWLLLFLLSSVVPVWTFLGTSAGDSQMFLMTLISQSVRGDFPRTASGCAAFPLGRDREL